MFNFFKKQSNKDNQDNKEIKNIKDINKDIWDSLEEVQSALTYYVKTDGEMYVDVNLVDYSEETLNNFSKVLAGISSLRFQLQTIDMVKHGFLESGKTEEFKKLLTQILLISREDINEMESYTKRKLKGEDPCIKPSDML